MIYLTAADILAVHDRIIEETGGLRGLREENLLKSIAERPKTSLGGAEQFADVFAKAAVYLESIATYHVFLDGNKRTAITSAGIFLMLNGYSARFPVEESERFILAASQRQKDLDEITAWLRAKSKKRKRP